MAQRSCIKQSADKPRNLKNASFMTYVMLYNKTQHLNFAKIFNFASKGIIY